MRQKNTKSKMARLLCAFLCFAMLFSAISMASCNQEEPVDPEGTEAEKETLEIETTHQLNENGKVEVLVFNTDAPIGTKISKKMLDTIEMDPENLPRNVVSDLSDVTGKYTSKNFYKGDYVIAKRVQKDKHLPYLTIPSF